jgi:hypothetical protein
LGGEAVAEVVNRAVEDCTGEVVHRGDGRVECPADLALEDVELGLIAEEAELEGEVLPNEESSNDV